MNIDAQLSCSRVLDAFIAAHWSNAQLFERCQRAYLVLDVAGQPAQISKDNVDDLFLVPAAVFQHGLKLRAVSGARGFSINEFLQDRQDITLAAVFNLARLRR